jgi:hypothetical protein
LLRDIVKPAFEHVPSSRATDATSTPFQIARMVPAAASTRSVPPLSETNTPIGREKTALFVPLSSVMARTLVKPRPGKLTQVLS